jgi:uncharacterized membrane protein YeaQ/YmgE (transglycosylase-associated protein family)
VLGWLAGALMGSTGKVQRLEEVLVGVFGAFIGGEFVVDAFRGAAPAAPGFSVAALGMGVLGAVVMLTLLKMMRGAVGPLRARKSPTARR